MSNITNPHRELNEYKQKLKNLTKDKILLVEDGSVDIDRLQEDGWYVIVYRAGSRPPMILEEKGDK